MRKIGCILLISTCTFGATSKVGTTFQVKETKQAVEDSKNETSSFQSNRIFGSVTGIKKYFDVNGFVNTERVDYSKVLIKEYTGIEKALGTGYEVQNQAGVGLGFGTDSFQTTLNAESYIERHPYDRQSVSASFTKNFLNKSTIAGISASYVEESRPETYFFNKNRSLERRPDKADTVTYKVRVEQLLGEKAKTAIEVGTSKNKKERPRNYSISWKNRLALSERVFAFADSYYIREDKEQILRNERGYFTAASQSLGLTYEPIYDLLVSGSWSVALEQENITYLQKRNYVGSDQYGMGVKYILPKMELDLTGSYLKASNDQETLSGGMSFTWLL